MNTVYVEAQGRYLQEPGILRSLGTCSKIPDARTLILISPRGKARLGSQLKEACTFAPDSYSLLEFKGSCTYREIERVAEELEQFDMLIGIGGGGILDTVKAAACQKDRPYVLVPTVPSSPACCTCHAVMYTDERHFDEFFDVQSSPLWTLADPEILVGAPPRLLAAGIGAALASGLPPSSQSTDKMDSVTDLLVPEAARICWELIMQKGRLAVRAAKEHLLVPALNDMFQVVLYLSGKIFDANGPDIQHCVGNALADLRGKERLYSGEWYAFGLLVRLVLENVEEKMLHDVMSLYHALGLPKTFVELGQEGLSRETCVGVASEAVDMLTRCEGLLSPRKWTDEDVTDALRMADCLGQAFEDHVEKA